MIPKVMNGYLRIPPGREIWNALSKAFYDEENELMVFNQKTFSTKKKKKKKGGKSITENNGN